MTNYIIHVTLTTQQIYFRVFSFYLSPILQLPTQITDSFEKNDKRTNIKRKLFKQVHLISFLFR